MSDWADDKAVETLKVILSPTVTIEEATDLLAAEIRIADAKGEHRGLRLVKELRKAAS